MSHIVTTIHGQEHHVDTGEDEHLGTITLDGQTHLIDWKQLAPLATDTKGHVDVGGRYSLIIEGKTYEVFARRTTRADQKTGQTYEIYVGGQRFDIKEVLVNKGQTVDLGDVLVVIGNDAEGE